MRFLAIGALLIAGQVLAATPREEAMAFTPEQAQEHAKLLCSRAGLVDVVLPDGQQRQLCGADRERALLVFEDVLDLLSRMNTEASRHAWVFIPTAGDTMTVFNLERSKDGFYQRPKVAFAMASSAFPADRDETAVRKWLKTQEAVRRSSVSAKTGALIFWHRVE